MDPWYYISARGATDLLYTLHEAIHNPSITRSLAKRRFDERNFSISQLKGAFFNVNLKIRRIETFYLDVTKFTGDASAPEKPSPQHLTVQLE